MTGFDQTFPVDLGYVAGVERFSMRNATVHINEVDPVTFAMRRDEKVFEVEIRIPVASLIDRFKDSEYAKGYLKPVVRRQTAGVEKPVGRFFL